MCYWSLKKNKCLIVWFPVRARTCPQDKSDTHIQQEEIWLYGILILFFSSVFLVDSWLGPLVPLSLFSSLPSVFLASLLSFFSDFSDFFSSFLVDGVLIRKKNIKIQWGKFSLEDFHNFRRCEIPYLLALSLDAVFLSPMLLPELDFSSLSFFNSFLEGSPFTYFFFQKQIG